MKKVILFFSFLFLLSACSFKSLLRYGHSTAYTNQLVKLGDSKEAIFKAFGKPFMENVYKEKNVVVEVWGYKEELIVGNLVQLLTTRFYFRDNQLVKKDQVAERLDYGCRKEKCKE